MKEIIHFSSGSLGSHPHETLILFEATVQLFAIQTKNLLIDTPHSSIAQCIQREYIVVDIDILWLCY